MSSLFRRTGHCSGSPWARLPGLSVGPMTLLMCLLMMIITGAALANPPRYATPDETDFVKGKRALQAGHEGDAMNAFLRSAEFGNKQAQRAIGLMYARGLSVEKSWPRAYAWMRLAASLGDTEIATVREQLAESLRPEEIDEAQAHYNHLLLEYGDVTALRNRERWVRRQKRQITGSRLGSIGMLRVQVADNNGYLWELSGEEYFGVLDTYVEDFRVRLAGGEIELAGD